MVEILFLIFMIISFSITASQYFFSFFPSFYNSRLENELDFSASPSDPPFISVHLPICNEPPDLVIKTIESLLNVNYSNYEIVVLDNNTEDRQKWEPVDKFCENKIRVKFIHFNHLNGHKAGALNKCIEYMNKESDYIFVLDADYQVVPEVLNKCVAIAENKNLDLLQFPQSYRNVHSNSELSLEYNSYFKVFMNMANWYNCVLSTGTLSFIRYKTLKNINGWRSISITEDAELGVRMVSEGYKTLYVDMELGYGLTPFDYHAFEKQRKRWVTGNMQVLVKNSSNLIRSRMLSLKQRIGIFFQLTAWVDFKIIALLAFFLLHFFHVSSFLVVSFWIYFGLMTILKLLIYKNTYQNAGGRTILGIFMINQSIAITTGLSWLKAFSNSNLEFEITEKGKVLQSSNIPILIFSMGITMASFSTDVFSSIAISILAIIYFFINRQVKNYFKNEIAEKYTHEYA